jgi:hypothetical protein
MRKKEHNILAINPGTKYLGLAVFQGTDLVYWAIKVLKGKWSREKLRRAEKIISDLIEQRDVNVLVLKRLHHSRSSRNLNYLVAAIERLAKKEGLRLRRYALGDLQNFLAPDMKVNKLDMAGLVVARYRFLVPHLEGERKHRHPYFVRMFEAIAAGMVVTNRLNRL